MSRKLKKWIILIGKNGKENTPNPFANGKIIYLDDIAKTQKRILKRR